MYSAVSRLPGGSSLSVVQRRALGLLFAFLAFAFVGIAIAAAGAHVWVVAFAAAAVGLWLGSLAVKALRIR